MLTLVVQQIPLIVMEISTNIVFVATDYVTKWVEAKAIINDDKHVVAKFLKMCFLEVESNMSIMLEGHILLTM